MKTPKPVFKKLIIVIVMALSLAVLLGTTGCFDVITGETPTTTPPVTTPTTPINPDWAIPSGGDQLEELPSIADVVALVKPSVVAINVKVPVTSFFGEYTQEGGGSGWVLDEDGIIVTNNHVVEGATEITVTLDDGRTFPVTPDDVFTDPLTDLAIVKIDAAGLVPLLIGDSTRLRVGDWVVAIGNSLGRGTRATVGIVSQLGVSLQLSQDQTLYNLIDTSAVINPGNSGGPLVNMAGEVVGITSAKIVATGAEATGFAIATEEATPIIQELVNIGYVVRPFLGVQNLLTMDQAVASFYGLGTDKGVLVRGIVAGSPAEQSGLKAGDIITSLGGEEVNSIQELTRVLYASEVGEPLEVTYVRDGQSQTVTVITTETPPPA
jgi:serine protease Do